MKYKIFASLLFFFISGVSAFSAEHILTSPDGNISVEILLKEKIYYTVYFKGERVLEASPLSLSLENVILGKDPELIRVRGTTVDETITPVWGSRNKIRDYYNQMKFEFNKDFAVEFRAYNTGVAYRFVTKLKEAEVVVKTEEVAFRFKFGVSAWMLNAKSYESNFSYTSLGSDNATALRNSMDKIFLPVFVQSTPEIKIAITEAGLYDYPSLFLERGNDYENYLLGSFEHYALTTTPGGFSNYSMLTKDAADYIAVTQGKREYPWRVIVISDDDKTFADCDLIYQLSDPSKLTNTDWIKPGKVSWEWWHDYVVEGEDFRGGVNTQTYKYHIDFASEYSLEYILIDWLWADKYDLTLFNPDVDLKGIIEYASSKNVKVIVWCPGHTLHRQLDKALDLFSSYGVAGVKVDFFGREDQTGIKMYEDIAQAAAARKMIVDFHGCAKPTGLSRTYPNVLNYEAVAGNEHNKLSKDKVTSDHKVMLPFTRGLQGPMDFTPGGMRNVQTGHILRYTLPMVHGTRCNELALYVIYNEPLKMLCDAPSVYSKEPEFTGLISAIPTIWDETIVLDAQFGKFLIEARKSGENWWVAGITGSEAKRTVIDFSFLGDGDFVAQVVKDGPNADRVGTDYLIVEPQVVTKATKLPVNIASGGGFIISIKKEQ